MGLPQRVFISECWARDGLQSQGSIVPTAHKLAILDRCSTLGLSRIEATSFANSDYMPQFYDQMEVLKGLQRIPNVVYAGLVTNKKGMEKALHAHEKGYGPDEIHIGMSVSEVHNMANMNKNHEEYKREIEAVLNMASGHDFLVTAWLGTSFGCPIAGSVDIQEVYALAMWFIERGITSISFGDTTGMANPRQVKEFYGFMLEKLPKNTKMVAHFHDTRDTGIVNCVAALEMGITHFDTCLGGLGGQPANNKPRYHYGNTGNVCTEDLICVFEDMGVSTGVDVKGLLETVLLAEGILGYKMRGQVVRCGPVRNQLK
ncbi:MAG: hydroxymethylglutaryl-CoA lyase [Carboxydocellales bacterium]|jgi:hydroxymethylglutaryl-CoA lyase